MSKIYNIRWKQSDHEELRKAVKNFNAKISRLERDRPEIKKFLPEKISVKEMRNLVKTRQDLTREIKSLKRFTKRGSEEIVDIPTSDVNLKTTKWQKKEMTLRASVINRKRKERLKMLQESNLERNGKDLGYSHPDIGMGKIDEVKLRKVEPFTPKMEKFNLNKKFKTLRRESQSSYWDESDLRLKESYLEQIEINFGDTEETRKLMEKLDNLSSKEFYATYRKDPNKFDHFYFMNEEDKNNAWNDIKSIWSVK